MFNQVPIELKNILVFETTKLRGFIIFNLQTICYYSDKFMDKDRTYTDYC